MIRSTASSRGQSCGAPGLPRQRQPAVLRPGACQPPTFPKITLQPGAVVLRHTPATTRLPLSLLFPLAFVSLLTPCQFPCCYPYYFRGVPHCMRTGPLSYDPFQLALSKFTGTALRALNSLQHVFLETYGELLACSTDSASLIIAASRPLGRQTAG